MVNLVKTYQIAPPPPTEYYWGILTKKQVMFHPYTVYLGSRNPLKKRQNIAKICRSKEVLIAYRQVNYSKKEPAPPPPLLFYPK